MTTLIAPYLYTEARLDIEPTYPNSTLHIPTESTSLFSGRKRARPDDGDADQDEDSYARKHIATEGSIFFRRKNKSPRSFLWRVLEDRKLLEIQSVDLVQSRRSTQESVLSYALTFANPIRHNGVAFADPEERDSLEIFVLTEKNELYTFSLRKDILLKGSVPTSTDFDPSSCYKCFTPSSFSFRHPYKLVATSSLELLISLHDGGLLRLDRKAGENGRCTMNDSRNGHTNAYSRLFVARNILQRRRLGLFVQRAHSLEGTSYCQVQQHGPRTQYGDCCCAITRHQARLHHFPRPHNQGLEHSDWQDRSPDRPAW